MCFTLYIPQIILEKSLFIDFRYREEGGGRERVREREREREGERDQFVVPLTNELLVGSCMCSEWGYQTRNFGICSKHLSYLVRTCTSNSFKNRQEINSNAINENLHCYKGGGRVIV